jgi:hypothetical protein
MTPEEKALLAAYRRLEEGDRRTLREFAAFLATRAPAAARAAPPDRPLPIPRPADETVVRAIKRLRATYPMLDPRLLLHDTSRCMSQHVAQGRPATEVIDELETVFARHYEKLTGGA